MFRKKVYRVRKNKSDISTQLDLTKRRNVLMKEIFSKTKSIDSMEHAFAHKTCSLALRLKNGRFRFSNSWEELNIALSKVFDIYFSGFTGHL